MNKMIPKGPSLPSLISCLVLTTGLIAGQQAVAKDAETAFKVAVISDASEGRKVLRGGYEQAIDKLATRNADVFSTSNNLCVAYLMDQQIDEARKACENAVAISGEEVASGSRLSRNIAERQLAVSLSNLGVLNALAGDIDAARTSFTQAAALGTSLSHPVVNLEHLQRRASVEA